MIYRGVDGTDPIAAVSHTSSANAATSIAEPSAVAAAGEEVVLVDAAGNSYVAPSWTMPSGISKQDEDGGATIDTAVGDAPATQLTATGSHASTASQSAQLQSVLLLLTPEPGVAYVGHDQQGSTRLLTDPHGAITASYSYDPYGRTVSHTGAAVTNLLYDGQYHDAETGLYYLRARYYDPLAAQFLTRDALESLTDQPYEYANDDPFDESDPLGLWGWNPISDVTQAAGDVGSGISSGARYAWQHKEQIGLIAAGTVAVVGGTVLTGGLLDAAVLASTAAEEEGLGAAAWESLSMAGHGIFIFGPGATLVGGGLVSIGYGIYGLIPNTATAGTACVTQ